MSMIALITARGRSKRIPRKNIKEFMGKPIIAYGIEVALKSGLFDEVMVSTDCPEIAQVARQFGANVPFMRSAENSDDFATTFDVVKEVILTYQKIGKQFDTLCCIYPCTPLLRVDMLQQAYHTMVSKGAPAIIPVCQYPVPIQWAMTLQDGIISYCEADLHKMRSQDLPLAYFEVGAFYFCEVDQMLSTSSLLPPKTLGYPLNEMEFQDIDTLEDWEMTQKKYLLMKKDFNQ